MADRFDVGDIIKMKKPHPCGSQEWEILRVGADFRLNCDMLMEQFQSVIQFPCSREEPGAKRP